jgi:hypothetical protein
MIKRYDCETFNDFSGARGNMRAAINGDYVLFKDHEETIKMLTEDIDKHRWISVEEFEKNPTQLCWIKYKGKVLPCITASMGYVAYQFLTGSGRYMTEYITAVMPITKPLPPETSIGGG